MRYSASEKIEIIHAVEVSHLPAKQTLSMIGVPTSTYYDWYARWVEGGKEELLAKFAAKPSGLETTLIGRCKNPLNIKR